MTAALKKSKSHVLIVDDEPQVLAALGDQLEKDYVMHAAASGAEGLALLSEVKPVSVVLSDQRMPNMNGDEFLARAAKVSDASRILITGFADLEAVIRSVNEGHIFGYMTKPWGDTELDIVVRKAEEHYNLLRALQHERDLLRNLMDNAPDMITFKDLEGRFIRVNDAFARFYGLESTVKAEGVRDSVILGRRVATQLRAENEEVIRTKRPIETEAMQIDINGAPTWLARTTAPVVDKSANVVSMVSIARDITTRKKQETKIAGLTRVRSVLSSVNSTIVRANSETELFREICQVTAKVGEFKHVSIYIVDEKRSTLTPVASVGPIELTPLNMGSPADAESRLTTAYLAFESKRISVCNDIEAEGLLTPFQRQAVKFGMHTVASLPLMVDGTSVGVINLAATSKNYFDAEEILVLEELAANIGFAMEMLRNRNELYFLALHDPLTGLPNRANFQGKLAELLLKTQEKNAHMAVAVVNLKRFRMLNDSLGRHVGDDLLRQVGARLSNAVGREHVARLSSDFFGVIIADASNTNAIVRSIGKMRELLARVYQVKDREVHIGARFGVGIYPQDGETAELLSANAEATLQKGREADEEITFYTPAINATVSERLDIEHRLRRALDQHQYVLHYQPKLDALSGAIIGAEALIRWNDPNEGLIPPGRFIPVLEETGQIVEVGNWALQEASRVYRQISASGIACPRIAVNVSQVQMARPSFTKQVIKNIVGDGKGDHGVDLEITESLLMVNIDAAVQTLQKLRERGFCVAVDDFGTGYSSLGYLAKLPVDGLKIDRSFIISMEDDAKSMAIVSAIINLAHSFKLKVIAEGVETNDQLKLLRLLNCDQIQGYLFHKPMPEEQFVDLLRQPQPGV